MNNSSRNIDLEKQIDAYVKGHLTQDEAVRLWVELLKHSEYIDLLETELHVKSIIEHRMQQARKVSPARFAFLRKSWKWVAAAFLGILVLTFGLLRELREESVQSLAFSSINMVDHLASPDILRAEKLNLSDVDSLFSNGFRFAISGQPEKALQIYEYIITRYPDDSKALTQAYFNVGIIKFNEGRLEEATAAFSNALKGAEEDRILEEKAQWFLANTYIQQNKLRQGLAVTEQVYNLNGIYREPAKRLINKLDRESSKDR